MPPPAMQSGDLAIHDAAWEAELLGLLSDLEQRTAALTRAAVRAWPPDAVRIGLDLLQHVADFAEPRFRESAAAEVLLDEAQVGLARAVRAGDDVTAAAGSKPGMLAGLFGKPKLDAQKRESCFWLLRSLPAEMERYFGVLGTGFQSGRSAAKWVETGGVYLTQLKRVVAMTEKA